MIDARDLQLSLWRAAHRHADLGSSIPAMATAVREVLPFNAMWVFALHDDRCTLAASEGVPGDAGPRFSVTGDEARSIARSVLRSGLVLFAPDHPGQSPLRPLAPALTPAPSGVLCGPLRSATQTEGLVAWRLTGPRPPDGGTLGLLAQALEPLGAALETARRFHEEEDRRRSAEADRQSALRRLGRDALTEPVIGEDAGLHAVMERVALIASSDVPALILGETGSGKEVIARAIHDRSARHDAPFIRVNCGAVPPELIDSQLFGHERGAFTGATDQRQGWFERADGGTLFLDEIGELPPAAQVRLLRVLQEGVLERVGGQRPVRVDCRIIAATHRDLAGMVRQRTFREDLWYRVAVFPLFLPPLRDRPGDLPALARHFAHRAAVRFGLPAFEILPSDLELLAAYDWPGNIRELSAVIDRAALLGRGHRLALPAAMGLSLPVGPPASRADNADPALSPGPGVAFSLEDANRMHIEAALRAAGGRVEGPGGAAVALRVNPNTLRSKMKKLGIDPRRHRP